MKDELANIDPTVRIVRLGLGEVVSNWGQRGSVPSVFIEPVLHGMGPVGQKIEDGREPQITANSVSAGGIVIEIHSEEGLNVFIEDLRSAWDSHAKFNTHEPPEQTERCGNHNHGWKAQMKCVLLKGHTGNHQDAVGCWWG